MYIQSVEMGELLPFSSKTAIFLTSGRDLVGVFEQLHALLIVCLKRLPSPLLHDVTSLKIIIVNSC